MSRDRPVAGIMPTSAGNEKEGVVTEMALLYHVSPDACE